MSTTNPLGNKEAVEGQAHESDAEEAGIVDEVAERERQLRPSVEQLVQARIDYGDARPEAARRVGLTLVEEERLAARAWEIERTRERGDRGQTAEREARCRRVVSRGSRERRAAFAGRAGSVDRWSDPDEPDARAQLGREALGAVNREAARVSERLGGWSTAAVSRLIAERLVETGELTEAVLATVAELEVDPGSVVPIARIGEVRHREVSVEGVVKTLWTPSHPSIAQVGLLEDESGRTKLTSWKRSAQPRVEVGDRIRVRDAAKSWHQGRWSIALTGRSRMVVL